MKREDIITILCKLKYCSDDFPTMQSVFSYELFDRKYQISFERREGNIVDFHVLDKGEVLNENN